MTIEFGVSFLSALLGISLMVNCLFFYFLYRKLNEVRGRSDVQITSIKYDLYARIREEIESVIKKINRVYEDIRKVY